MISSSSLEVSRGSAYRIKLTPEEMFLHYLDCILMALDLFRTLIKLMELCNRIELGYGIALGYVMAGDLQRQFLCPRVNVTYAGL